MLELIKLRRAHKWRNYVTF